VISESGINKYSQIRKLSHYANSFLIASALMAETDLRAAVLRVILGENKVCGLTRPQDAAAAYQAGAIYGRFIFVGCSARYVAINRAREVISDAPLKYVGMFYYEQVTIIAQTSECLGLQAVIIAWFGRQGLYQRPAPPST